MHSKQRWLGLMPLALLVCGLPVMARGALQPAVLQDRNTELKAVPLTKEVLQGRSQNSGSSGSKQSVIGQDSLLRVEGSLSEGDATLNDGSLYEEHTFQGQAGQIVRITLESGVFDTYLLLVAPSGALIAEDNDGGSDSNSEIVVQLPEDGPYRVLANAYDQTGRGAYQLVAVMANVEDFSQVEADRLFQLGIDQFRVSQFRAALASWQAALELYRVLENRQGEANSLGNLGLAYDSLGNYQQAIDHHQQSLAIKRNLGDRRGEANSLSNLGLAYDSLGNYPQAIDYYQQALDIARDIGDRPGEAASLGNLGNAHYSLGDYRQAINYLTQTLAIARDIGNRQREAGSLGNLGLAHYSLGDYPQAIDYYQQALAIAGDIGNRQGEANALGNLGNTYRNLGNYQQAIDYHQQSLAIARDIGDRQGEVNSLGNLGNAYRSLRDYEQAISHHEQSLDIAHDIGYRQGEANALGSLGNTYHRLGDYQQAIDYHQRHLAIARDISDRQGETNSLGNLGSAYGNLGNYSQAIDYFEQTLTIARDIGNQAGEANALNNLGFAYLWLNRLAEAEDVFLNAIAVLENLRNAGLSDADKIRFFDTQTNAYKGLEQALILQDKPVQALEVSERGRSRAFIELLAERLSLQQAEQLSPEPPDFTKIQQIAAAQQGVLVEYSLVNGGPDSPSLYIWVVQPDGELDFRKVSLDDNALDLAELVSQSRQSIGVRGRGGGFELVEAPTGNEQLRQLYQLLIEPIADLLPPNPEQRVIFMPQGELFLVPFPALIDATGNYLIEKHTLLTAPSIQTLDLTRQQRMALEIDDSLESDAILTVGNPTMPEVWNPDASAYQQLSDLPGAEQEALAIGRFFNIQPLLNVAATEQAIKQQIESAHIVHFATHGLLEYGSPEDSGVRDLPGAIALAPGQGEDGLLTSAEIRTFNLQAELVVLSACDTGRGRITGDGVIGLSRSFIEAGTPSVIVSLWSVPDAPTAALMTEFYRQLQQGQDKAQALRQAMLTTLENHPEPKNWAAFTLIGEAN
ncbi:MAG: tetratricopeptide repeat protein [Cyanobacteria bacterium J06642_9]